jgi:phosphoglycolate phosphatase
MSNATVIFDFDGTLANSIDLIVRLYNAHVDEFGYKPIHQSEYNSLRQMGYTKAMKAKGVRLGMIPRMVRVLGKEMRLHMDEVQPYDGVIDIVKKLHSHGFGVGVLTSNQAELVANFFERHAFPPFDFVVSEKTLFGKDRALKRILKRYGLTHNQVVYVGDEPRDVSACRKANLAVIGVSWGLAGKEGFASAPPDVIVDSAEELLNTIVRMAD